MKPIKEGSVVEVIWDDATGCSEWTTKDSIEWPEMRCITVGYFMKQNDRAIMLMDSLFEDAHKDDGTVGGMKTIPLGMVIGIRVLRAARSLEAACKPDRLTRRPSQREEEESAPCLTKLRRSGKRRAGRR